MVQTVKQYNQPALGLTDHGNMSGTVQLYTHAVKAGIKPFPGTELYLVNTREDKRAKRHHMCAVAYTTEGYQNLVALNTRANMQFYNKPILDLGDLAELGEAGKLKGIAGTSGCYFGFISQMIVNDQEQQAKALLGAMDKWFDRFYVELQNHNIEHDQEGWSDDLLADRLYSMAEEMGLPMVLTQDAHYCHPEDKDAHDALKRLVAYGPDEDDAIFPGDGFHLATDQWFMDHHSEQRLRAGRQGLEDLLEAHDLSIKELDSYHYNIPFTVEDPQQELVDKCTTALQDMGFNSAKRTMYMERLLTELEIIKDTGMAGYLVLVAEVTDWCRTNRIFYQARGSASGSIVCWLMGITQVDPIKYKLRFEQFISRDRTKPPDVDLDVEHVHRQDLIEWLNQRFAVHQIGTWLEYSLAGEDDKIEEKRGKGSLRVRYYARLRALGKPIDEWDDVPQQEKDNLYKLADISPMSAYGTHAAGLVVTSTEEEFGKLIPLMKVASSGIYVTQYEMKDIDKIGYVKLDVLGLKTLTVLHKALDNLGRDVFDGWDWIPLTDADTFKAISKGNTDGVFQLEGKVTKIWCRNLRPTKIGDVIAAMALFRTAVFKAGTTQEYIARRHKDHPVPQMHTIFENNTKYTYGLIIYQEQIVGILRDLGMSIDDLDIFLNAVKASQKAERAAAAEIIGKQRQLVQGMCDAHGISDEDFLFLWSVIEGFADYGFKQAHATAYGLTAYYCAYLSVHHSLEFHSALLEVAAGTPKESGYVNAVRAKGIRIAKADVNASQISYGVDPSHRYIRRGLLGVKGIGIKAAREIVTKRPPEGYVNLKDLCTRVNRSVTGTRAYLESGDHMVGAIGKLWEAGALDSLIGND